MSIRENLHNYYEKLVAEELEKQLPNESDLDYLADVACVALNHLPPRYFRHEIDMAFYLSPTEYQEMVDKVVTAVSDAVCYVDQSLRDAAAEELEREEQQRLAAEAAARTEAEVAEEEEEMETQAVSGAGANTGDEERL